MGYIALITLDLPGATDEQRSLFYETLRNEKWQKIKSLTTAWKALFNDSVTRDEAIRILRSDIIKAKQTSHVTKVEYGIQLDRFEIIVETQ